MPNPSEPCKICHQPAFTLHFGVLSCRACAAFFRRWAKEEDKLRKRRCSMSCDVENNRRKHCAPCRFKDCLSAGMRILPPKPTPTSFTPGPIFQSLHKGYRNLEQARKLAFGLTEEKVAQPSTYTVQNAVVAVDLRLIIDNFISESDTFRRLTNSQKSKILSQYIAPLHIIECTYKAADPNHFFMLANGDYIAVDGLSTFYNDLLDSKHQQAFRVFKPYWDLQHRLLHSYLDEVRLDLNEFLFLVALMLWDIDFHECEEQLMAVCIEEKRKIIRELCDYERCRQGGSSDDRSMRVGKIVMILHAVQRTLNMLYESAEVSKLYQLDALHYSIYESLRNISIRE